MPTHAKDTINRPDIFFGTWSVRRLILDRKTDGRAVFEGEARIDERQFSEQGETLINGFRAQSARRYSLMLDHTGVEVKFPDGRDFIKIACSASQRVHHDCGDDVYKGRFFFPSHDGWIEAWHVTGPRKNYRSLARYVRF